MSFRAWFKRWILAFYNLVNYDRRRRKSEAEREKERLRRAEAKHSSAKYYRAEKKRKRRRKSAEVNRQRLLEALFGFLAATLSILLMPIGLIDWGYKSIKNNKALAVNMANKSKKTTEAKTVKSNQNAQKAEQVPPASNRSGQKAEQVASAGNRGAHKAEQMSPANKRSAVPRATAYKSQGGMSAEKKSSTESAYSEHVERVRIFEPKEVQSANCTFNAEPDESVPKSQPKHECDTFIRKRMIIAGSSHYSGGVLSKMTVGTHFDAVFEPENLHDKNAVRLEYLGEAIGYIPRLDAPTFAIALKVGRKIYGVITEIKHSEKGIEYEFEAWFDYGN